MSGENLSLVGKLTGHRRHRTTAGYAHLADGHLVEAAEKVGGLYGPGHCLRLTPPDGAVRAKISGYCGVIQVPQGGF